MVLARKPCGDEGCSNRLRLEHRLSELQEELDALREDHVSQVRSLFAARKSDTAREVRERGEAESALAQLLEVLTTSSEHALGVR